MSAVPHTEPGFQATLHTVAKHYGVPEGEFRAATGVAAENARAVFIWLSDYLKSKGVMAAASFVGVPYQRAIEDMAKIDEHRAKTPALQQELEELALTLQVEAGAFERLQLHRTTDATPVEVARRALASLRSAGLVGVQEMQMLASAYIARVLQDGEEEEVRAQLSHARAEAEQLRAAVAALNAQLRASQGHPMDKPLHEWTQAALALERASGIAERSARQRYENAARALQTAAETHFNIKRSFK